MTRKDYEAIATAIATGYKDAIRRYHGGIYGDGDPTLFENEVLNEALVTLAQNIASEISAVFTADNENYDMAKFHEAVLRRTGFYAHAVTND